MTRGRRARRRGGTPGIPGSALAQLDNLTISGAGFTARCPAHTDVINSLTVTPIDGGRFTVYCHAGCTYAQILAALGLGLGPDGADPADVADGESEESGDDEEEADSAVWWGERTGIPWEFWRDLGAEALDGGVGFGWAGTDVLKVRPMRGEKGRWLGDGPRPWLWPAPVPSGGRLFVTEGEGDAGILLAHGIPACSLTKGARGIPPRDVWDRIRALGAEDLIGVFDADTAGRAGAKAFVEASGGRAIDLAPALDVIGGETDIRDWYRRDPSGFGEGFLALAGARAAPLDRVLSLGELLARTVDDGGWLVDRVWPVGAIGMIAGDPKVGKSWLAVDLALSVASGTDFLGHFPVVETGAVLYIPKEDPGPLIWGRLARMLTSRGEAGGTTVSEDGRLRIALPRDVTAPLYLDQSYDFQFTVERSARLFAACETITARHGGLAAVVFDPLLRMIGPDTDIYDATAVGRDVWDVAQRIRERFGAAVVVVHHRSKADKAATNSFGSVGMHAFSEAALYVQPLDKEGYYPVAAEYKGQASIAWRYRIDLSDDGYLPEVSETPSPGPGTNGSGPTVTVHRVARSDEATYDFIVANPGSTAAEIMEGIGRSRTSVDRALGRLRVEGKIIGWTVPSEQKGPWGPAVHWRATEAE